MIRNFNKSGTVCKHNTLAQVELVIEGYFDLARNITRPFSDETSVQDLTYFHLPHIVSY